LRGALDLRLQLLELLLEFGDEIISELAGALIFALTPCRRELVALLVKVGLELLHLVKLVLLCLPAAGDRGRTLLQRGDVLLDGVEALLRARVSFLLQ